MSLAVTSDTKIGTIGILTVEISGGWNVGGWAKDGHFQAPGPVLACNRVSHDGSGHSEIHTTVGERRCVWHAGAHSMVTVRDVYNIFYTPQP